MGRRKGEELRGFEGGEKDLQKGEKNRINGRGWREARGLEKLQVIWDNIDGNRVV